MFRPYFGMLRNALMLLVVAGASTACGIAERNQERAIRTYRETTPTLNVRSDASFAVAALDRRPFVLSGKRDPAYEFETFKGFIDGWVYVHTPSGRPVAAEMAIWSFVP